MRVALKIAYDGRAFFGHQRQPDRRTVEGECLAALRSAKILRDPSGAFFRSASRTDRGVSAVGNVIAFDGPLKLEATVGAFNDKARDVWAWAAAAVPDAFHPRHALERWYRYVLLDEMSLEALRRVASRFVGSHDFRSFCSEPLSGPLAIESIDVSRGGPVTFIDVRARSFRRGMVRRIVAAMLAVVRREATIEELEDALAGGRHDFGSIEPEPLVLMDVRYDFPFQIVLKPKVAEDIRRKGRDLSLQLHLLQFFRLTMGTEARSTSPDQRDIGFAQ